MHYNYTTERSSIWEIGLDGMIGGNGSYVEDHGKVIMHQKITGEQCQKIVDWLHQRKLEFYLESNQGLFASEHFEERADAVMKEYAKRKGHENPVQVTVRTIFLETRAQFPDMENGTWGGKGEEALFGDLGVKGITKANAIEHLLKYLNANQKDTIAFGDAKIDIPMLEYCNIGVAMGSGGSEIRAVADYVTDDVDRDGLYKAFVHLKLIDQDGSNENEA